MSSQQARYHLDEPTKQYINERCGQVARASLQDLYDTMEISVSNETIRRRTEEVDRPIENGHTECKNTSPSPLNVFNISSDCIVCQVSTLSLSTSLLNILLSYNSSMSIEIMLYTRPFFVSTL